MTLFDLALVLVTPWLVGCGVLRLLGIRWRDDRLAYPAWAWLAGTLLTALLLFCWLFTGWSIDAFPVGVRLLALLALLGIARGWLSEPRAVPDRNGERRRFAAVERGLLLLLVAFCLGLTADRAVRANADECVLLMDEAWIWAAKGKAIYLCGGFNDRFAELMAAPQIVFHKDYPLLNPLLQVWTFAHLGRVADVENRWVIQGFIAALLLAFAGSLARVVRPLLGAVFLLLLVMTWQLRVTTGLVEADGLVALGLFVALDALLRLHDTGEKRWWRLAAVALAFLAWSKNEGMALALCVVTALACVGLFRRLRGRPGVLAPRDALLLLPALGIVAAQVWVNRRFGFENDITSSAEAGPLGKRILSQAATHVGPVARSAYEYGVRRWSETFLVLPISLALLALFPRRLVRLRPLLLAVLGLALLCFLLVYLGTPRDIEWHLRWSIQRILFQLQPVTMLWLALATQEVFRACLRPDSS